MRRSPHSIDFVRAASVVSGNGETRRAHFASLAAAKAAENYAFVKGRLLKKGVGESEADAQARARVPAYRG